MRGRPTRRTVLAGAAGVALLGVAGCNTTGTPQASTRGRETGGEGQSPGAKIAGVTAALLALGPNVNEKEGARAAEIAVLKPLDWAREWQVEDPPLLHNVKVTNGIREKGVCRDWANALYGALRGEGFRTLDLHIGMANARNVSLEHVSLVVTAKGQPMQSGVLLDPWRIGQGRLWYARVADDPRYRWETLESVRAWQAANRAQALENL